MVNHFRMSLALKIHEKLPLSQLWFDGTFHHHKYIRGSMWVNKRINLSVLVSLMNQGHCWISPPSPCRQQNTSWCLAEFQTADVCRITPAIFPMHKRWKWAAYTLLSGPINFPQTVCFSWRSAVVKKQYQQKLAGKQRGGEVSLDQRVWPIVKCLYQEFIGWINQKHKVVDGKLWGQARVTTETNSATQPMAFEHAYITERGETPGFLSILWYQTSRRGKSESLKALMVLPGGSANMELEHQHGKWCMRSWDLFHSPIASPSILILPFLLN